MRSEDVAAETLPDSMPGTALASARARRTWVILFWLGVALASYGTWFYRNKLKDPTF